MGPETMDLGKTESAKENPTKISPQAEGNMRTGDIDPKGNERERLGAVVDPEMGKEKVEDVRPAADLIHGNTAEQNAQGQIVGDRILSSVSEISDSKTIVVAEPIVKIGNEMIERLMVMQAVNGAKQEVVIVFKEHMLPGTQVSLVREGTSLNLSFSVNNLQSMEVLTANHSGLRNFLLDQLKDINAVNIEMKEGHMERDSSQDHHAKQQRNREGKAEDYENADKS
jgi:hypothetical protein